ncbi:MAG: hypothetical protein ACSHXF_16260 [Aquaticitalea sp.]
MAKSDILLSLFDSIVFGYGLSVFLVVILLMFKSEHLKSFNLQFLNLSTLVVRLVGMFYVIYYSISLTIYLSSTEVALFNSRASGNYAWAYWFMLLRPFLLCGLIQLLWIKKIRKSIVFLLFLTFIILILALSTGPNMERFIILMASVHRDYSETDWELKVSVLTLLLSFFLFVLKSSVLFSSLVFGYWFLFKRVETN